MRLSEHFTLAEFTRSDTAVKLGLSNEPDSPQALENLRALAATMEQVRGLFGSPVIISSGYRNRRVNAAVGGVPNSDHALGHAVDFMVKGFDKAEIVRRIREEGCFPYDQLIDEPSWVHLSIAPRMRRQNLIARRTGPGGKMVYTAA